VRPLALFKVLVRSLNALTGGAGGNRTRVRNTFLSTSYNNKLLVIPGLYTGPLHSPYATSKSLLHIVALESKLAQLFMAGPK